jgi:hypothetical protein
MSFPIRKEMSRIAARMKSAKETIVLAVPAMNFKAAIARTIRTIRIINELSAISRKNGLGYLMFSSKVF